MMRFRLGQHWKRESANADGPHDAFGFEVEGVDLLVGAGNEALAQRVPELVEAIAGLAAGERVAELSLSEARLELCFFRTGAHDVEVTVLGVAPFRKVRGPLRVELSELMAAAAKCARGFAQDLADAQPELSKAPRHRAMLRKLRGLESGGSVTLPDGPVPVWSWTRHGKGEHGVRLSWSDGAQRLAAWKRRHPGALTSLLIDGSLGLDGQTVETLPVLELLERVKAALAEGGERHRDLFEAGHDACIALAAHAAAQRKNPHLELLYERCTAGLAALRPLPDLEGRPPKPTRNRAGAREKPLPTEGALRRLRFDLRWEKSTEVGDDAHLFLARRGPVVVSPHAAWGFDAKGKSLFRRVDTRGVAVSLDGKVLTSGASRLLGFTRPGAEAQWFTDHSGAKVGPQLWTVGNTLITVLERRGVAGYCVFTGREQWRFEPPRAQQAHISLLGDRLLVATDGGSLFGLDTLDGRVLFRVRAMLPFARPASAWGRRALAVLARSERTVVFLTDPHGSDAIRTPGALVWTRELTLSKPSAPVLGNGRVWLAGMVDQKPHLFALSRKGEPLWDRPLPGLEGSALSLLPWGHGVIAVDGRGAAVRVSATGEPEWTLGNSGEVLQHDPGPKISRGVLLLPGVTVRAVEPRGGRVLAELPSGRGLLDLQPDGKLNVYTLDDAGVLRAFELSTTLSVV